MTNYIARVKDGGEYVDRTLATASWWDRHQLVSGDYPFESHGYGPLVARIDSILVEEYRENRLMQHVNGFTRDVGRPAHASLSLYDFDLKRVGTYWGDAVEIVEVEQ